MCVCVCVCVRVCVRTQLAVRKYAQALSSVRHLLADLTLPLLSVFSGTKFDEMMKAMFQQGAGTCVCVCVCVRVRAYVFRLVDCQRVAVVAWNTDAQTGPAMPL